MLSSSVETSDAYGPAFNLISTYIRTKDGERHNAATWELLDWATEKLISDVDGNYYSAFEVRRSALGGRLGAALEGQDDTVINEQVKEVLKMSLMGELLWCRTLAVDEAKSFALASYRMTVVERILALKPTYKEAMELLAKELNDTFQCFERRTIDRKNHTTWSYANFILQCLHDLPHSQSPSPAEPKQEDPNSGNHTASSNDRSSLHATMASLFEKLLGKADRLLVEDVFNNSIWAFRFAIFSFLRSLRLSEKKDVDAEWGREVLRVVEIIAFRPNNISAWNYFFALYSPSSDDMLPTPLCGRSHVPLPILGPETSPVCRLAEIINPSNHRPEHQQTSTSGRPQTLRGPNPHGQGFLRDDLSHDALPTGYMPPNPSLVKIMHCEFKRAGLTALTDILDRFFCSLND